MIVYPCYSIRMLSLNVRVEYVLSTLDKIANWARQGSMWPMTFGARAAAAACPPSRMRARLTRVFRQAWRAARWR